MSGAPRPRRVLLVHGAWHGAWCWERMLAPLRALGYEPEAIDLPGHGRSAEPLTDLHGDADAVRAHLDAIGEPTLLVGHSYGGMVITDAGTHDAVAGLAYVAAYMPDTGQTVMDLFTVPALPKGERPSELVAATRFSDDRSEMRLHGDGVTGALYRDCDPVTQQWAVQRLDAQSTASFTQAPRRVAWTSRPSIYVVCTQDRTIPVWRQRRMAMHADRVIDLPASHSPFLSMPERLAGVLAEVDSPSGTGRSGDADSKPAPAPATTSASQPTMKITIYGWSTSSSISATTRPMTIKVAAIKATGAIRIIRTDTSLPSFAQLAMPIVSNSATSANYDSL